MPSRKNADDHYDDEYAKEKGKQDARREARRQTKREAANDRYQDEYDREMGKQDARDDADRRRRAAYNRAVNANNRAQTRSCLLLVALFVVLPVLGCVGLIMFVFPLSKPISPDTTPTTGRSTASRSDRDTPPTTSPAPTAKPTEPVTRPAPPTTSKPTTLVIAPRPKVTLTPPKSGFLLVADSKYVLATATREEVTHDKWVKDGLLRKLTVPTEVEVLGLDDRDEKYTRVKLDGKEWFAYSSVVPVAKK